jgi:hypothetical protein
VNLFLLLQGKLLHLVGHHFAGGLSRPYLYLSSSPFSYWVCWGPFMLMES